MEKLYDDDLPTAVIVNATSLQDTLAGLIKKSIVERLVHECAVHTLIDIMPFTVALEGEPTDLLYYVRRRVDGYSVWYDNEHRAAAFEMLEVHNLANVYDGYYVHRHNVRLRELVGEVPPDMKWLNRLWSGNPSTENTVYYNTKS